MTCTRRSFAFSPSIPNEPEYLSEIAPVRDVCYRFSVSRHLPATARQICDAFISISEFFGIAFVVWKETVLS